MGDDDNSGCLAAQATACEVECSPADTSSRVPDPTKTFYPKASKSPKITYTRLDVTFACDEAAGTGTCDVDCCDINDILPSDQAGKWYLCNRTRRTMHPRLTRRRVNSPSPSLPRRVTALRTPSTLRMSP